MHFLDVLAHKLPSKTFDTFAYLEPNIADIMTGMSAWRWAHYNAEQATTVASA